MEYCHNEYNFWLLCKPELSNGARWQPIRMSDPITTLRNGKNSDVLLLLSQHEFNRPSSQSHVRHISYRAYAQRIADRQVIKKSRPRILTQNTFYVFNHFNHGRSSKQTTYLWPANTIKVVSSMSLHKLMPNSVPFSDYQLNIIIDDSETVRTLSPNSFNCSPPCFFLRWRQRFGSKRYGFLRPWLPKSTRVELILHFGSSIAAKSMAASRFGLWIRSS